MNRSTEQRRRRRLIASAAAGRTAVVLYACTEDPRPDNIFDDLRRYAAARDWEIARQIADAAPLSTPRCERAGWGTVCDLIQKGLIEGVVVPQAHLGEECPSECCVLDTWLADRGAFLAIAPLPSSSVPHPACRATHFLTHFEADPT